MAALLYPGFLPGATDGPAGGDADVVFALWSTASFDAGTAVCHRHPGILGVAKEALRYARVLRQFRHALVKSSQKTVVAVKGLVSLPVTSFGRGVARTKLYRQCLVGRHVSTHDSVPQ